MKKILLSITLLALLATTAFAQKKIKDNAYIKYELKDVKSNDPQAAQMVMMMKGSIMEMYLSPTESRTVMNMMGGMMVMDNYNNSKTDENMNLMNMMGQKIKIVPSEKDEAKKEDKKEKKSLDFKYDKKKTKEIAGYKCYYATTTQGEVKTELYITDKIVLKPLQGSNMVNMNGLAGYPLEFTVTQPQMTMTFTALEVDGKLAKDAFEISDEGYKEMPADQLGSMGGGMGF